MGSKSTVWKYLMWVTALSASLVGPIALSVLCAFWLQQHYSAGGWVMPAAIFLGLGGAAVNLMKFFRFMQKESEKGREDEDGRF